ncbi:MAG: hypothetical protein RMK52_06010 [Chitinophagales bacterium]|nr:hypothetical protein [Chitinophagales bacterium]
MPVFVFHMLLYDAFYTKQEKIFVYSHALNEFTSCLSHVIPQKIPYFIYSRIVQSPYTLVFSDSYSLGGNVFPPISYIDYSIPPGTSPEELSYQVVVGVPSCFLGAETEFFSVPSNCML